MMIALTVGYVVLAGIIAGNLFYLRQHRPVATTGRERSLSVMIPARNEEQNLPRLLTSLLSQDHSAFEVLVYDDGSEDGTREVLRQFEHDARLRIFEGTGPPAGWVGKVHALHRLTREARGDVYLFLDADVELTSRAALRQIAALHDTVPQPTVLTALPRLRGGGKLLVSLVPHIIIMMLPWFLVRRMRLPQLGALNGQCWMIDATLYHAHEPHLTLRNAVLEDVEIGRLLKARGVIPVLADLRQVLDVYMYRDLRDAWAGLTKNAYLIVGGSVRAVVAFFLMMAIVVVLAPLVHPAFVVVLFLFKAVTDHVGRFPFWVSLLMPLSYLLAAAVLLASMTGHLTGRVTWKGRNVAN